MQPSGEPSGNGPIPIAVMGIGKIARDQHLPTIASLAEFRLAALVSREPPDNVDVPCFPTIEALAAGCPEVRALSICTPPIGRNAALSAALACGLHVLMEKPPAATISEAESFAAMAAAAGRTLFASWHAREAPGVELARQSLEGRQIDRVLIEWLEDVRVWHPGQEWIWAPGVGVFDPGINALSIATHILPGPLTVREALLTYPADRAAPIEARLSLMAGESVPVDAHFSFDHPGEPVWRIMVETGAGAIELAHGGNRLSVDGEPVELPAEPEYARLYRRFADLIARNAIDTDLQPFRLVADAFLLARHTSSGAFAW